MTFTSTLTLREAAEAASILAARRALDGEAVRRLDKAVVRAIVDGGFARHFVPTRWGGLAGGFIEASEAVSVLGEGCTSAAWLASIFAYSGRLAAFLPEAAQAEVWAEGADQIIASALVPAGRAEEVPGGWRVHGEWLYISGVDVSDWALVCAPVAGGPTGQPMFFAVPRSDYSVKDTWHTSGLRATMSNTLVVEDVFVPAHRTFPRALLITGLADLTLPVCHRIPLRAAGALAFAVPIIGAATGALKATVARQTVKRNGAGRPGGDGPAHLALTRAAGEIDAARMLIERVAACCDEGRFDGTERARHGRDGALATDLAVTAVQRLMRLGGTSGYAEDAPVQRFWRDVSCAATHQALRMEAAATTYGPVLLGQSPGSP
ncbi:MAG: acyl-CoA dehydrogenase family protein [Stackebrandtia sp.]